MLILLTFCLLAAWGHEDKVYTYPLYGNITELSYYYVNMYMGSPPQVQSMIVDTGSEFVGVSCREIGANLHKDPLFDRRLSGSFAEETCADHTVNPCNCSRGKCAYREVRGR